MALPHHIQSHHNFSFANYILIPPGRILSTYLERDGGQLVHSVRGYLRRRTAHGFAPAQPGAGRCAAPRTDVAEQASGGAQQIQE